jgi:hypothetical protein
MIKDERLMFREVIVKVIVTKLVLKGYRNRLVHWPKRSPDLTLLDICFLDFMKNEVYKVNVDTPDDLLAPILDVAARKSNMKINSIKTRSLHTSCKVHCG